LAVQTPRGCFLTGQITYNQVDKYGLVDRKKTHAMPERFSEIESSSIREPSLEERLKAYPELKAKIETMLGIIENSGGEVQKAAEAERRIIEELRQMGNEVLHCTAGRGVSSRKRKRNTMRNQV
jgi:nucleotidyltransferase/DNA polymerase involved in DNA repair